MVIEDVYPQKAGALDVAAWEEPLAIRTYRVGAPERAPLFFTGRSYQRAAAPIYPYPMLDSLGRTAEEKTYRAVFLENRYLRICILPELGGRIFSALDKTNGYDFVYRQQVIKPGLVGMLGAWVSGGVEWNVPHHHRATSFLPVNCAIESKPGGGKTVWVGELELRDRMRWAAGVSLYPDRAYLEITVKVANPTPLAHSMLYFSNIAVHANRHYQVIFPPGTEYVANHSKKEFSRWPISESVYNGIDFREGVDVSRWRNHPGVISMFAWENGGDFFGGYDHGKGAGTVHVANRFVFPGKKFFTWGAGSAGQGWDGILTDEDGPYIELMAGAYSDNQPDYSWISPYETREFQEYLFPVSRIGGFTQANRDAALNLEMTGSGRVRAGVHVTAERPEATITLHAGEHVLAEEQVTLAPGRPYVREFPLPDGAGEADLLLTVRAGGRELIRYRPVPPPGRPEPRPVRTPAEPAAMTSNDELFLTGLRLEQLHNAALAPAAYYEEALRRDPGDVRCHTALGVTCLRRGELEVARRHLEAAVSRATAGYVHPKDAEAIYYLALTVKEMGEPAAAYELFCQAAWSRPQQAAACFQLALLCCRDSRFADALEFAGLAVKAGNAKAGWLRAALLRKTGRAETAAVPPLDAPHEFEAYLQAPEKEAESIRERLRAVWGRDVQSFLELAFDYADCWWWDDAARALRLWVEICEDPEAIHPMVYYALGYFASQSGDRQAALGHYRRASQLPADYCFPFRPEEAAVLRAALEANPSDARAACYLGNALYDAQPEAAIEAWERARSIHPAMAMAHRNLAWGYARTRADYQKAVQSMEQAIACGGHTPRFFVELDDYLIAAGAPAGRRLRMLEENLGKAGNDEKVVARLARVLVELGSYDQALELLAGATFHVWEGAGRFGVYTVYCDAHILRGHRRFAVRDYSGALRDYEAALAYPASLGTPKPERGDRLSETYYWMGVAAERLGATGRAAECFEEAVRRGPVDWRPTRPAATDQPGMYYYVALALRRLGRGGAEEIGAGLVGAGEAQLQDRSRMDFFVAYGEPLSDAAWAAQAHLAIGLGHRLGGREREAAAAFREALRLDGTHLEARYHLSLAGGKEVA